MRQLELPAGKPPREWGRIHGETFRGEVKALAAIRTYLCTKVGGFRSTADVHAAAAAHLPVLERYHAGLYDELVGIAEGAALSPADIVVANHYTDLRDLDPDPRTWRPAPLADDPRVAGHAGVSDGGDGTGTKESQASAELSGAGPRDATRGGGNGPALPDERRRRSRTEEEASQAGAELSGAGPRDATRGGGMDRLCRARGGGNAPYLTTAAA